MNRCAEVHAQRLTACRALHLDRTRRDAKPLGSVRSSSFSTKLTAAVLVRHDRAGDVVAAMRVGRRGKSRRRDEAHALQPGLVAVLVAVAVAVVEDLAGHVGAVEGRVRNDAHRGRRFL